MRCERLEGGGCVTGRTMNFSGTLLYCMIKGSGRKHRRKASEEESTKLGKGSKLEGGLRKPGVSPPKKRLTAS